jgi:hypothetical protein
MIVPVACEVRDRSSTIRGAVAPDALGLKAIVRWRVPTLTGETGLSALIGRGPQAAP